jgi:hypothetical protein
MCVCVLLLLLYTKCCVGNPPTPSPRLPAQQIVITHHRLFIEPICNTSPISIATIGYYNIGYQKCLGDFGRNYIF